MAERRCISKSIYTQKRFLELPVSARDLYTYLVLYSDIDGVVEAYSVMRIINASVTDLKLLDECQYVKVLNEDWVTYINNFTAFNTLDGRGMKGSNYRELLVRTLPNVQLTALKAKKRKKSKNDEEDNESDSESHGTTVGLPCTTQPNLTQLNSMEDNDTVRDIITLYNVTFGTTHPPTEKNEKIIREALQKITKTQALSIITHEHHRVINGECGTFHPNMCWMFGAGLSECLTRINNAPRKRKNQGMGGNYGDMAQLEADVVEN